MLKFTVLLPVYNGDNASFLKVAIESIIQQTMVPDEILLLIDGPVNKNIKQILDYYSKNYQEIISVIYFKENRGLGKTLNDGVLLSRNEIIARMDADDFSLPNRFEKQIAYFKNDKTLTLVGGNIQEYSYDMEEKLNQRVVPSNIKDIRKFAKIRNPFNHMTVMFRKSDVLKVGNYNDISLFEDYYLWIKLLLAEKNVCNIPEILVDVRAGDELIVKRSGFKYLLKEIKFQNKLLECKYISLDRYIINIFIRGTSRLIPKVIIKRIYTMFLRKN